VTAEAVLASLDQLSDGMTDLPASGVPLGPFRIFRPIGRGGMGEVWAAEPLHGGPPVAVKVLTADRARDPRFVRAFREEVRAVARLDHPGIIHVFDHGLVDATAAATLGDTMLPGAPWLAMELVEGTTLGRASVAQWTALQDILFELLDALAHAHARDLIHRDLKPDNVLVPIVQGLRQGIRLTDFGAAHAWDRSDERNEQHPVVGTVAYMPPEQIEGDWRDQGPWTDLYALGCVAWRLCTGRHVFEEQNLARLLHQQVHAEPPALWPTFSVPAGFEGWLRCLLSKDPALRYQRAADAAYALHTLGPPVARETTATPIVSGGAEHTHVLTASGSSAGLMTLVLPLHEEGQAPPGRARSQAPGQVLPPVSPPPVPDTWRRKDTAPAPLRPGGAGTGLFGLRTVPLVGREAERDLLWEALRTVSRSGEAQVVLLTGAAGVGKSRLAAAMAAQLHEVGAATLLRGSHTPQGPPGHALVPLLNRHLRCVGLQGAPLAQHLSRRLGRLGVLEQAEVSATVRALSQSHSAAPPLDPAALRAVVRRVLSAEAGRRPVVLLLDDLDRGPETVQLVLELLASPVAVLVLATARESVASTLRPLVDEPRCAVRALAPLTNRECTRLASELLGLSAELASRVAARAEGNPLFTVQLVSDWVARGVLEPRASGFDLRADSSAASLPDSLHDMWSARVRRLLPDAQTHAALELAAVLGRTLSVATWRAAAAELDLPANDLLLEGLVEQGLAELDLDMEGGGLTFGQALLVESLVRSAEESGRLQELHAGCARTLAHHAHAPTPAAVQLAIHAEAAGLHKLAIDALFSAARYFLRVSQVERGQRCLATRNALLDAEGVGDNDPRRVRGWALRSELEKIFHDVGRAVTWGERAVEAGRRCGHTGMLVEALVACANAYRNAGRMSDARTALEEAVALHGDVGEESRDIAQRILGDVLAQTGELDEALAHASAVHARFQASGDRYGLASNGVLLGRIHQLRGDLERAERIADQSRRIHREDGYLFHEGNACNLLGEIQRQRGDLDAAARSYAEGARLFELAGSSADVVSILNLALVEVLRGRYLEGLQISEELADDAHQAGHEMLRTFARAVGLPGLAEDCQGTRLDAELADLEPALVGTHLVDPDVATCARLAGDRCAVHGDRARAERLWQLAEVQWRALGRTAELEDLARRRTP